MFRTILIANRGEIACRIIRTAKRLGIRSVAVFSDADREAFHVRLADEARPIGPAPARASYLSIERIIAAARASGVAAVHPGYGFLSENADFAEACAEAGLVFVGPPPSAIRAMGSKASAKRAMSEAGVPIVPGYHGEAQGIDILSEAAESIGYPVLIKASAGGGGKGMRIVERAADLAAAVDGAKREARASFGDDRVLIERYLAKPRHVEVQVFADRRGNCVSLFERDCSVQRRHQKVIEEAPAPDFDPEQRVAMGKAAVAAARAVGYEGAGTVEFIAEGGRFFFMEMNTRLQVEHPVTEMITGQDLVEWQFRVASGEPLPLGEADLAIRGHAVEARIYAEDPGQDFRPAVGTVRHLRQPRQTAGLLRIDAGVREGDRIVSDYDPMIAKLIVWGEDRSAALRRLAEALGAYEIVGVATNLDLLRAIAGHADFRSGAVDTGFIARHANELMSDQGSTPAGDGTAALAAGALAVLADMAAEAAGRAAASADPHSPWATATAWRLNGADGQEVLLRIGGAEAPVAIRAFPTGPARARLDLPCGTVEAELRDDGVSQRLVLDGVVRRLSVVRTGADLTVVIDGRNHPLTLVDPLAPPRGEATRDDRVLAPIPGRIASVLVAPGAAVAEGAPLVVMEAMKMEIVLRAPRAGTVADVPYGVDDRVTEGTELVIFSVAEPAS